MCPEMTGGIGGTVLVCRDHFKPKLLSHGPSVSYEYLEWHLQYQSHHLLDLIVYRPPYSNTNQFTINYFIDE